MLTISCPLSSGQAQKYHVEEFTSRSQSYYAERDHVHGEWQGRLAEHFGPRGDVRPDTSPGSLKVVTLSVKNSWSINDCPTRTRPPMA